MTIHPGNTILLRSSQQVPLSPSRTLDGLVELTRRPISAFSLNGYVCSGTLEKPWHWQVWHACRKGLFTRTADTNLDYAFFLKNTLVLIDPKIWRVPGPLRPPVSLWAIYNLRKRYSNKWYFKVKNWQIIVKGQNSCTSTQQTKYRFYPFLCRYGQLSVNLELV